MDDSIKVASDELWAKANHLPKSNEHWLKLSTIGIRECAVVPFGQGGPTSLRSAIAKANRYGRKMSKKFKVFSRLGPDEYSDRAMYLLIVRVK